MNLILNYSEGADHIALLKRVDFRNISGPLSVDMERVPFFLPPTLALLYGIFKYHYQMYSQETRTCLPSAIRSADTDVNRYVQRVNFFNSCPELVGLREEAFRRHDPSGRFVPITEIHKMDDTDAVSQKIIQVIFSQESVQGETTVKYALSELVDNALQHSSSLIGCVVQAQQYRNDFVDGVLLDCGIGVRRHLSGNREIAKDITSDEKAVLKALEPYVSGTHGRKKDPESLEQGYHNAGLGLSICCEIMKRSGGFLQLISGEAGVLVDSRGVEPFKVAGWPGTLVVFRINYQMLANISDIIKEFDKRRLKGDNLNRLSEPEFI